MLLDITVCLQLDKVEAQEREDEQQAIRKVDNKAAGGKRKKVGKQGSCIFSI